MPILIWIGTAGAYLLLIGVDFYNLPTTQSCVTTLLPTLVFAVGTLFKR